MKQHSIRTVSHSAAHWITYQKTARSNLLSFQIFWNKINKSKCLSITTPHSKLEEKIDRRVLSTLTSLFSPLRHTHPNAVGVNLADL